MWDEVESFFLSKFVEKKNVTRNAKKCLKRKEKKAAAGGGFVLLMFLPRALLHISWTAKTVPEEKKSASLFFVSFFLVCYALVVVVMMMKELSERYQNAVAVDLSFFFHFSRQRFSPEKIAVRGESTATAICDKLGW